MEDFSIPPELTHTKPIREIIYEYLREAILDGRLKPGGPLGGTRSGRKVPCEPHADS